MFFLHSKWSLNSCLRASLEQMNFGGIHSKGKFAMRNIWLVGLLQRNFIGKEKILQILEEFIAWGLTSCYQLLWEFQRTFSLCLSILSLINWQIISKFSFFFPMMHPNTSFKQFLWFCFLRDSTNHDILIPCFFYSSVLRIYPVQYYDLQRALNWWDEQIAMGNNVLNWWFYKLRFCLKGNSVAIEAMASIFALTNACISVVIKVWRRSHIFERLLNASTIDCSPLAARSDRVT